MSRAGTLRRWTICAAALAAGALPLHAQGPATAGAPHTRSLLSAADSAHLSRSKKHRLGYSDVVSVTALTPRLAAVEWVVAPGPRAAVDTALWAALVTATAPSEPGAAPGTLAAADTATAATPASIVSAATAISQPPGSPPPVDSAAPSATTAAASLLAGDSASIAATAAATSPPAGDSASIPATAAATSPPPGDSASVGTPLPAAASAADAMVAGPQVLGTPVPGLAPAVRAVAPAGAASSDFLRRQLTSPRVLRARSVADSLLRAAFEQAGVAWGAAVYLRAFKREHELEVWGRKADSTYALVKTFSICSLGGSGLGPKLHRGDEQVPEGFYHIVAFNPASEYHLSLRLDYPNAADRARRGGGGGGGGDDLGGDIYLHGGCRSAGCLPLTDTGIEQVYWLAVQARAAGERRIPIAIFPARLDAPHWAQLSQAFTGRPDLLSFWSDLKAVYDAFEQTRRLPDIAVDADGRYHVALASP